MGGGFLGLPVVAAPAGFGPTVATLVFSWLFLLAEAFVVAEAVSRCRSEAGVPASMARVAREAGFGGAAIRGVFFALVTATLASQLSKAGALMAAAGSGARYRAWTGAAGAATLACAVLPAVPRVASLNALLTAAFGASIAALAAAARGGVPFDASRLAFRDVAAARGLAPTVLQLLVFAETIPTVAQLLDDDPRRVRLALVAGSLAPLLLEIAWAALGLGIAPRPCADPVDVLLALPQTRAPAAALAASAVATTALGSALALRSDVAAGPAPRAAAVLATLPAIAVSLTSPAIFLGAMDFAGAYPVALLWGVFPPLAALRLRRRRPGARTSGPDAWLVALAAAAALFVASTAARDLGALFFGAS